MIHMTDYIVEAELPTPLTEEFLSLIPLHRMRINELMAAGKVSAYVLALDRSKLWLTLNLEKPEELWPVLESLPLAPYLAFDVTELAFQLIASQSIYQLSLN